MISAKIASNEVKFYLDGDEAEYRTDNPELDSFKEFLLLNGVKVSSEQSRYILYTVTDMVFYIIFFGVIIFGLYKLLILENTFKIIRDNKTKFQTLQAWKI